MATYACTAEGQVLDVLPGIYEPNTYVERLAELKDLHRYAWQGRFGRQVVLQEGKVKDYHRQQAEALATGNSRGTFVEVAGNPAAIIRVESSLKLVMQPALRMQARRAVALGEFPVKTTFAKVNSPDDLAGWQALAHDTEVNETLRRRQIHEYLAELGAVPPEKITKWLYREVLHADLDDPYLGLGKVLFDNYPFRAEDEQ